MNHFLRFFGLQKPDATEPPSKLRKVFYTIFAFLVGGVLSAFFAMAILIGLDKISFLPTAIWAREIVFGVLFILAFYILWKLIYKIGLKAKDTPPFALEDGTTYTPNKIKKGFLWFGIFLILCGIIFFLLSVLAHEEITGGKIAGLVFSFLLFLEGVLLIRTWWHLPEPDAVLPTNERIVATDLSWLDYSGKAWLVFAIIVVLKYGASGLLLGGAIAMNLAYMNKAIRVLRLQYLK